MSAIVHALTIRLGDRGHAYGFDLYCSTCAVVVAGRLVAPTVDELTIEQEAHRQAMAPRS